MKCFPERNTAVTPSVTPKSSVSEAYKARQLANAHTTKKTIYKSCKKSFSTKEQPKKWSTNNEISDEEIYENLTADGTNVEGMTFRDVVSMGRSIITPIEKPWRESRRHLSPEERKSFRIKKEKKIPKWKINVERTTTEISAPPVVFADLPSLTLKERVEERMMSASDINVTLPPTFVSVAEFCKIFPTDDEFVRTVALTKVPEIVLDVIKTFDGKPEDLVDPYFCLHEDTYSTNSGESFDYSAPETWVLEDSPPSIEGNCLDDFLHKEQETRLEYVMNYHEYLEDRFSIPYDPKRVYRDGQKFFTLQNKLYEFVEHRAPKSPSLKVRSLARKLKNSLPELHPNGYFDILKDLSGAAKTISEAKESIPDVVTACNGITDTVKEATKSLSDSLSEASEKMSNIKHEHTFNIKTVMQSASDSFMTTILKILPSDPITRSIVMIFIIATLYFIINSMIGNKIAKYGLKAIISGLLHISDLSPFVKYFAHALFVNDVVGDITAMAFDYFAAEDEDDEAELEVNSITLQSTSDAISSMSRAIVNTITGFDFDDVYELAFKCATFKKMINGTAWTVEFLFDGIIELINLITSPFGVQFFKSKFSQYPILNNIGDTFEFLNQKFASAARVSRNDYRTFRDLVEKLNNTERRLPMDPSYSVYRQQIGYLRSVQRILEVRFKTLGIIQGTIRMRPYVYTLVGPSQIGKTQIQDATGYTTMPILIGDDDMTNFVEDPDNYICSTDPSLEYDQTYRAGCVYQKVDDIFQMANIARDPKICHGRWLIGVANNAPKAVNRAFADKGEVFYNPMVLALSTNKTSLNLDELSVCDLDAVANRMGDCFFVDLKPEYKLMYDDLTDGRTHMPKFTLDKSKLTELDFSIYLFKPYTFKIDSSGNAVGVEDKLNITLEYHDWIRLITTRIINHRFDEEVKMNQMSSINKSKKLNPFYGMTTADIMTDLMINPPLRNDRGACLNSNVTSNYEKITGKKLVDVEERLKTCFDLNESWIKACSKISDNPWKKIMCLYAMNKPLFNALSHVMLDFLPSHGAKTKYANTEDWCNDMCIRFMNVNSTDAKIPDLVSTFTKDLIEVKSIPKTVLGISCPGWLTDLFSLDESGHLKSAYEINTDFFSTLDKDMDYYMKWWSESGVLGSLGCTFSRAYLRPDIDAKVFMNYMKQLYYFCSNGARRLGGTMVEMLSMLKQKTWSEVMTSWWRILKTSTADFISDAEKVLHTSWFSLLYSGFWSNLAVLSVVGALRLAYSVLSAKNKKGELIVNAYLNVKFKGKGKKIPKAVPRVVAKTVAEALPVDAGAGTCLAITSRLKEKSETIFFNNICSLYFDTLI